MRTRLLRSAPAWNLGAIPAVVPSWYAPSRVLQGHKSVDTDTRSGSRQTRVPWSADPFGLQFADCVAALPVAVVGLSISTQLDRCSLSRS